MSYDGLTFGKFLPMELINESNKPLILWSFFASHYANQVVENWR